MIRSKTFVWTYGGDYNDGGWKPEGMPNFYAGGPVIVAHDTVEHFNDNPAFHYELLAFGATVYARMHEDDTEGQVDVSADDLIGFLKKEDLKVRSPNQRWDKPLADAEDERRLRTMMDQTRSRLMFHYDFMYGRQKSDQAAEAVKRSEVWIRLGYRIAARKYKKHGPAKFFGLFKQIFDATYNDFDYRVPEPGERLTVSFDTDTLQYKFLRSRRKEPVAA